MNCKRVYISTRATNKIITETFSKIQTETGGILLGTIHEGIWHVIESIDPGPRSIFTPSYFEYDTDYVNHLAKVVSREYRTELRLLGLWHRHPGSFDSFSSTDDQTNTAFSKLSPFGAISGIVNLDPKFRMTMYHVANSPLHYKKVGLDYGDRFIPDELNALKHSNAKLIPIYNEEYQDEYNESANKLTWGTLTKAFKNFFTEPNIDSPRRNESSSQKRSNRGFQQESQERNREREQIRIPKERYENERDREQPQHSNEPLREYSPPSFAPQSGQQFDSNDERLLDILVDEEILIKESDIDKVYVYNRNAERYYMVYEFLPKIPPYQSRYPKLYFSITLDPDHLVFLDDRNKPFPYRSGIFKDYIVSKIKNIPFNG
jgi:hypothetical protein